MKTSKSPCQVLRTAHLIGELTLAPYSHRCSPKKFTQPQLFACLVLKEFLQFDYRKLEATLRDSPTWCQAIGLKTVPDHSTFHKAAKKLLRQANVEQLLGKLVQVAVATGRLTPKVALGAMDGTGFESQHASRYYVERCQKGRKTKDSLTYRRFPKAGLLCDTKSHFILSVVTGQGPGPDILHFRPCLDRGLKVISIEALAADAGYDAEHTHVFARERRGVRTLIPPLIGRPTDKLPAGRWRRQMALHLKQSRYGQRWQIETVNSLLKRLLGSALRARSYWSRCRELNLRAITLDVMILCRRQVFDRAFLTPLFCPQIPIPAPPETFSWTLAPPWRPQGNPLASAPPLATPGDHNCIICPLQGQGVDSASATR
jgi:hypothetical protein